MQEDVKRCPICGGDNKCRNPAGDPQGSCWCYGAVFPEELLERVPASQVRKSCICSTCLDKHLKEAEQA
ncbi:cysteine-rich CWC family protein [Paenibacillus sepulcri]|uniref:Cysteine-rich CWC family protein n=1 Tax=Paenibacillus sepulcri TaxID=359917 RepID=A0ABS7CFH9_9BACL|nr:cysteine-rich CWC family protein [Paenibacillus sepulcri]